MDSTRPGARISLLTAQPRGGVQQRILDQISLLADQDFAGWVRRPFITAMYTGRRPDRNA